jgi:hypothetical protein
MHARAQSEPERPRVYRIHPDRNPAPDDPLELLAYWLDSAFQIPGLRWRFGLDPLIGLIPGLGDLTSTFMSLFILGAAVRYGVPKITLLRMGLNLGLDFAIGAIPVVGDLFDAWWKANLRNMELLRRARSSTSRQATLGDYLFVGLVFAVLLVIVVGAALLTWTLLSGLFSLLTTRV